MTRGEPDAGASPLPGHEPWEDVILAALDGRADAAQQAELSEHLSGCAACRDVEADYRDLFRRLRDLHEEAARAPGFWDGLALDIEQRVAAEQTPPASGTAVTEAASNPPAAGDDDDVVPLQRGWSGVAGGLLAASIGVLLLVGVYLRAPRPPGEPQAFTTPPASDERLAAGEAGTDRIGSQWESGDTPPAAPDDIAIGDAAAGARGDPFETLADPMAALDDLTPAEAEEVLRVLEAQT